MTETIVPDDTSDDPSDVVPDPTASEVHPRLLQRSLVPGSLNGLDEPGPPGPPGQPGPGGAPGPAGPPGQGIPEGGEPGQVLAKNTSTNYDTVWVNQSGGKTDKLIGTSLDIWQPGYDWTKTPPEGIANAGWRQVAAIPSTNAVVGQALFAESFDWDWQTGIVEFALVRVWTTLDSAYYLVRFEGSVLVDNTWVKLAAALPDADMNLEVRRRPATSPHVYTLDVRVRIYNSAPTASNMTLLVRSMGPVMSIASDRRPSGMVPGSAMNDAIPTTIYPYCLVIPGPHYLGDFRTSDDVTAQGQGQVKVGSLDPWWNGAGSASKQNRTAEQFIEFRDSKNPNVFVQQGFNGGGQFERGFYDSTYPGPGSPYRLIDTVTANKDLWWLPVGAGFGMELTDGIFGDKSPAGLVLRVESEQGQTSFPEHHISYLLDTTVPWPANTGDAVYLGAWTANWNLGQLTKVDLVDSGSLSSNAMCFEFATGAGASPYDSGWMYVNPKVNAANALNQIGTRLEVRITLNQDSGTGLITTVMQLRVRLTTNISSYKSGKWSAYFDGTGMLNWKRNSVAGTTLNGVTYPARGTQLPVAANPAATAELTSAVRPGLPSGGAANQVLSKIDGSDYNTQWTTPASGGGGGLPVGGAVGAPLVKKSATDLDVQWGTASQLLAFSNADKSVADLSTTYPAGQSQFTLSNTQALNNGWPCGSNYCQVITYRPSDGGSASSQRCLSTTNASSFAYYRSGNSNGWGPWVQEIPQFIGSAPTIGDSGWHSVGSPGEPAYKNGAYVYDGTGLNYVGPRFRRDVGGCVHFDGIVYSGVAPSATAVIFTLPAGFRPAYPLYFFALCSGGPSVILVNPNGDVIYRYGNTSTLWTALTCINFMAEDGPNKPNWVNVTLGGGWSSVAAGAPARYCIDNVGDVHLSGLVSGGGSGSGNAFFTLPAAQAPDATQIWARPGPFASPITTFSRVDVDATGRVMQGTGGTTGQQISLEGIVVVNPQGSWYTPAMTSPWVAYGGAFAPLGWCRNANGVMASRGLVKNGSANAMTAPGIHQYPLKQKMTAIECAGPGIVRIDNLVDSSLSQLTMYLGGSNTYVSVNHRWFHDS